MADKPRPESIEFFQRAIRKHDCVKSVEQLSDQKYILHLIDRKKINIYLTDIYTVGIADVMEIETKYPEVNCILTISNWNGYTKDAKCYAEDNKIGLFLFGELMGALNFDEYWKYFTKDHKGKPNRWWRA